MITWMFPVGGYDADGLPVGAFKPTVWAGAHWESNTPGVNHKHWSLETPDATGRLQTRFEVIFGDPARNDAIAGLDKTRILTNQADLVVRAGNGQVLRIAAGPGQDRAVEWSNDPVGASPRWRLAADATPETGGDAGSDLRLTRYGDSGAADSPLTVSRATGKTALTGGLDITRLTGNSLQINPPPGAHGAQVTGAAGTRAYQAGVNGEPMSRIVVTTDGRVELGGGQTSRDVTLTRPAAGVLELAGVLRLAERATTPTGPALFVQGGALRYVGAAGTVTTLGPA